MIQQIELENLTPDQALIWLVNNDPEAKDFWESQPLDGGLPTAVWESLRDFGAEHQTGDIFIIYEEPKLHFISCTYEREDGDTDEDYAQGVKTAKEAEKYWGICRG